MGAAAYLLVLGDFDQAGVLAARAKEINSRTPGVNEILGIVFQNKGKINQAMVC